MVSAYRVVACGWMEGSVVVSVAGQRRSVTAGILACVIHTGERSHERSGAKEGKC